MISIYGTSEMKFLYSIFGTLFISNSFYLVFFFLLCLVTFTSCFNFYFVSVVSYLQLYFSVLLRSWSRSALNATRNLASTHAPPKKELNRKHKIAKQPFIYVSSEQSQNNKQNSLTVPTLPNTKKTKQPTDNSLT